MTGTVMIEALASEPNQLRRSAVTFARPYLGPPPICEPPFDDEPNDPTRRPVIVRAGRIIPLRVSSPDVPGWSRETDIGVVRTSADELPPATRSTVIFARALSEVLSGLRPVEQLRTHCAADVFAGLKLRQRNPLPGHPRVTSIRICEPADGVAEASAVIRLAGRVRALAFRLQGIDGRWRVTELQLG